MKYSIYFVCLLLFCFVFSGCDNSGNGNGDTYTAAIAVVNTDDEEYRLLIGKSDDLYNAGDGTVTLEEGEIVIESIPGGNTEIYELDLGTNTSLAKDWILQHYDSFFKNWSIVVCTTEENADGYMFEGNESYTITIVSTANITIQSKNLITNS